MPQPVIKDVGYGPNEDIEDELEETDERSEVVTDGYLVNASTVGLREYLSKDHHSHC